MADDDAAAIEAVAKLLKQQRVGDDSSNDLDAFLVGDIEPASSAKSYDVDNDDDEAISRAKVEQVREMFQSAAAEPTSTGRLSAEREAKVARVRQLLNEYASAPSVPRGEAVGRPLPVTDADVEEMRSLLNVSLAVDARTAARKLPESMASGGKQDRDDDIVETKSITKAAIGLCYIFSRIDLRQILFDDITVGDALNNLTGIRSAFDYAEFMAAADRGADMGAFALAKVTGKSMRGVFAYNDYVWQVLASRYASLAGESITTTFGRILRYGEWEWRTVRGQPLGPNGLSLDMDAAWELGASAGILIQPLPSVEISESDFPGHGPLIGYKAGWFVLPDGSLAAIGYRRYYIVVSGREVHIQLWHDDYVSPLTPAQNAFLAPHQMMADSEAHTSGKSNARPVSPVPVRRTNFGSLMR